MNARKIFLVLGGACIVLLLAAIIVALWLFAKNERDRKRDQTEPARAASKKAAEQKREAAKAEPGKDEGNFEDVEQIASSQT